MRTEKKWVQTGCELAAMAGEQQRSLPAQKQQLRSAVESQLRMILWTPMRSRGICPGPLRATKAFIPRPNATKESVYFISNGEEDEWMIVG